MKGYLIGRKRKEEPEHLHKFSGILMLSAWGFAMVLSSFLFLYLGYLVDEILGTTPNFMLCSFFLAKRMKRVILMAHLSDGDNNAVSDFLVDRESSLFDLFFDEESTFLG